MRSSSFSSSKVVSLFFAVACGAIACTTAEPPRAPTTTTLQARPSTGCPLGVPGAHVAVDETELGVAMTFTAMTERLADLRARAADAAGLYGPGAGLGKGHDGRHGEGGGHGLKAMQLPPAFASAESIDGGARIYLVPLHTEDLELLREKVRLRAQEMMSSCSEDGPAHAS